MPENQSCKWFKFNLALKKPAKQSDTHKEKIETDPENAKQQQTKAKSKTQTTYDVIEHNLRINVIFMRDETALEPREFLEIKVTKGPLVKSLMNYKIIGISYEKAYTSPSIDLIINLWNERTNKKGFFCSLWKWIGLPRLRHGF